LSVHVFKKTFNYFYILERFGTILAYRKVRTKRREDAMKTNELLKKIAKLESLCDQLQSEMNYIDSLLREVGFEEGMETLKEAAIELIEKRKEDRNDVA